MSTRIDGKANASHTHSYLPLNGGTLTGALTVNGEIQSSSYIKSQSWVAEIYIQGIAYYIRRTGNLVTLSNEKNSVSSVTFEDTTSGEKQLSMNIIPIGYRPYDNGVVTYIPLISGRSFDGCIKLSIKPDGYIYYKRYGSRFVYDGNVTRDLIFSASWYTSSAVFPS